MERRAFTRVPADMDVTITNGMQVFQGRLANVSVHGMLIRTPGKLRVREEVDLSLRSRESGAGPSFLCRGTVVRVQPGGIAVELQEMTGEDFSKLLKLVLSLSPDPEKIEAELRQYVAQPR